jgi:RNA ligase (TIGR02306 family)
VIPQSDEVRSENPEPGQHKGENDMRQLATIQTIADVQPIPDADAIEKVKVRDWWCVAKKGEFSLNEKCVYFEIDSLLPSSNPNFSFLAKSSRKQTILLEDGSTATGYRLKTVRLRKQISQGLALNLGAFGLNQYVEVGTDVSEELGIYKWEPPISKQPPANAKGNFPSFIPKTDEERVQNLGRLIERHAGEIFFVTEKLDGMSVTCYRTPDGFGVCSRNLNLLPEDNTYWRAVRAAGLEETLPLNYALQGEIIGEGIQGNPLQRKGQQLFVFNAYDIAAGKYLEYADFVALCSRLGVMTVPILETTMPLPATATALIDMADGQSALNPNADREGLVFRPINEDYDEIGGTMRRLSFKAISNRYLLSEK